MSVRKLRIPIVAACFVILLFLSPQLVRADGEPSKFHLGGAPGTATAVVKDETLTLTVVAGSENEYSSDTNNPKKFGVIIGGCSIDINGSLTGGGAYVRFDLKKKGLALAPSSVTTPSSIMTTKDGIVFKGTDSAKFSDCKPKFGDTDEGDAYRIKVELYGSVPKSFNLISDALLEVPKVNSAGVLPLWGIIALSVGSIILLVILSAVGGFVAYRRCKKKALKQNQEQLETAKSLEAEKVLVPTPVKVSAVDVKTPEPVSKKTEPKKVDNKKNEAKKNEAKKNEAKKERPKEGSGDKPTGKKVRVKESDGKKLVNEKRKPKTKTKVKTATEPTESTEPTKRSVEELTAKKQTTKTHTAEELPKTLGTQASRASFEDMMDETQIDGVNSQGAMEVEEEDEQ